MDSIQNVQGATSTTKPVPAAKATTQSTTPGSKALDSNPQPGATDTVQISSAAKAALQQSQETPLQEAMETPFQTAQEAANGDSQAKRLLAQEAAAKQLLGL